MTSALFRSRLVLPALLLFLPAAALAGSPGLFDQPQTFPWTVGLTPVVQEEAGGLEPGALRLRSSVLWCNTYRQAGWDPDMTQQIDLEALQTVVSAAWSPAPGWELRSQVQGWFLGGGVMDGFFGPFHGLLGVPNQGRENVANNGYRDYLRGSFDLRTPGSGLTQASAGFRAFAGPWSWTGWVKVPVPGRPDWGWSDQWGGGLGAGWGDRWPVPDAGLQFRGGLSGALVLVGPDPDFPGQTGPLAFQGGVYAAAELFSGPRLLAQGAWTSVPRSGQAYLSQGAGLLTVGLQFPLDRSWTLEAALTEEFLTWATMEVGYQAGLVWTP